MAIKKLVQDGFYGEVELNNCAFPRDGRIEAQCQLGWNPADNSNIEYVENGMILAINNGTRSRGTAPDVETITRSIEYASDSTYMFGLNYTTEHMYDERLVGGLRYFKLGRNSFYPRLGYLAVGDKFTTNTVSYDDSHAPAVGDIGYISKDTNYPGYIRLGATLPTAFDDYYANAPQFKVIQVYTMPDGMPAVKLQCIKA